LVIFAFIAIMGNQEGNFNLGGEGGSGDGGQGNSGDGGNSGGDGGSGDGGTDVVYPEGLDKEYHGNKTLLKYLDKETGQFKNNEVFKALIHASSQIGSDKMSVPNDKFTPDQWKETYSKLGLPDQLENYGLADNLAEGQTESGLLEGFKKAAHENGVLPKQAQALFDYMNGANHAASTERNGAYEADRSTKIDALKTKWGEKFDHNVTLAGRGIEQFASAEEIQALTEQGLMDSPLMTDIFQRIGAGLLEDQFDPSTTGTVGSTKDEVQNKIKSFYDKDHPFMTRTHPQNAFYVKEMTRMLEQVHGKKVVGAR